jgi:hypothetical protein
VLAFELDQAAASLQSPVRRAAREPVEDDYSEESFPDEDRDGDLAWRAQEMVAASRTLSEARRWAKRPYREAECAVPSA